MSARQGRIRWDSGCTVSYLRRVRDRPLADHPAALHDVAARGETGRHTRSDQAACSACGQSVTSKHADCRSPRGGGVHGALASLSSWNAKSHASLRGSRCPFAQASNLASPTDRSAPPLANTRVPASTRGAVSAAPSTRLPFLVRSRHAKRCAVSRLWCIRGPTKAGLIPTGGGPRDAGVRTGLHRRAVPERRRS
jgi:hypothetical protein